MPEVSDAIHNAQPSVEGSYDEAVAKDNPRRRAREPDKDQAGDYGHPEHAHDDLGRNNDVPVDVRRIHMPVSDRRQGFDAKEQRLRERARRHFADARAAQSIRRREDQVNGEIDREKKRDKARPAQTKNPVIGVAPST